MTDYGCAGCSTTAGPGACPVHGQKVNHAPVVIRGAGDLVDGFALERLRSEVARLQVENARLQAEVGALTDESSYAYAAMGNFLHAYFGWEKKQEGAYRYDFTIRKFIEVINDKFIGIEKILHEIYRDAERHSVELIREKLAPLLFCQVCSQRLPCPEDHVALERKKADV